MLSITTVLGRRTKQAFKIEKEKTTVSQENPDNMIEGKKVSATEVTCEILSDGTQIIFSPDSISFAGYEKEAQAAVETFIIVNKGSTTILGFTIEIIYKDLKNRMIHSRTVTQSCNVPPRQTRKIDIQSWDKQKTYYYYLGNEPRKVATPYKTEIIPSAFYIEASD